MKTSLQSLSPELLGLVEGQLSNDEDSSDDELVQYFIQSGLTEVQARGHVADDVPCSDGQKNPGFAKHVGRRPGIEA
ncbi:hypothetical protein [Xanthomonas hortorum]|uniref:hypothetical protein n=1 Tax=Xanthomonas hortorum TaxID=56454 RepID=UPI0032E8DED6